MRGKLKERSRSRLFACSESLRVSCTLKDGYVLAHHQGKVTLDPQQRNTDDGEALYITT